jgi:hypothetical protein
LVIPESVIFQTPYVSSLSKDSQVLNWALELTPVDDENIESRKQWVRRVVLLPILVVVGGFVSFVLIDPVKNLAKHTLWPENIEVGGLSHKAVVGIPKSIQIVLINRSIVANISGGTVNFETVDKEVRLRLERTTFVFPKSETSVHVPQKEPFFKTFPLKSGPAEIKAVIETIRGLKFNAIIKVDVVSPETVLRNDFTGVWQVRLNKKRGQMILKQNSRTDRHFQGKVTLDGGKLELTIEKNDSYWDGTTFRFFAYQGEVEYEIQARFCHQVNESGKWVIMNGDFTKNTDDTYEDLKYYVPRYEEKCPVNNEIEPREHSGSFFAQAIYQ